MIFGIDLGTTNSLIGVGDELLTGLVSSNVDVSAKKQVPRDVVSEDIVSSYKTNMSVGETGKLSVQCSAIILKELARLGSENSGQKVEDVVISVPAYFTTSQREAVYKAAEIAGLNLKQLINEPTAAAIYTCRDTMDLIIVYDLGGGTFDVSIVDSRAGTYTVIATDGVVLGGDDLDIALMEEVIKETKIPLRFRDKLSKKKLKSKMRLAKEEIQRVRGTVYVDLKEFGVSKPYALTEETYVSIVQQVFGKTIEMTETIISKYIPSYESAKMVLVGGSAACPYLKQMLVKELWAEGIELEIIPCVIDPDLIVAKGVALYAEMMNEGKAQELVEDVTKRLCLELVNGGTQTIIEENTIVPCKNRVTVSNSSECDYLELRLYQGDSLIAKNNAYIGTLRFEYGRVVAEDEGLVDVSVEVTGDGVVVLSASEVLFGDVEQVIKLTAR